MTEKIFVAYDIPKTKEDIVKKIEEIEKYKPINWLSAMNKQAELESLRKKL